MEFANNEFTYSQIELIHGKATDNSKSQNYKKQASQVRAAILQAKEYFSAANNSSLYTSPNHLYYGMVSLNTAIMLMLGDGRKSLDVLRRSKENLNHGLIFTTNCTEKSAKNGLDILEKTHVAAGRGGFFRNWYETLPKTGKISGICEVQNKEGTSRIFGQIGEYLTLNIDSLAGDKASLLSILKYIPDISTELVRYGIDIPLSRTTAKRSSSGKDIEYEWIIHGTLKSEDLSEILKEFKAEKDEGISTTFSDDKKSAIIKITANKFNFPLMRRDMNTNYFIYAFDTNLHEIVEAFGAGFAFSMLSRYYPDIWVSCLESHCKAAKLIEHIIGILLLKFPILALSMISGTEITISTQKPSIFL